MTTNYHVAPTNASSNDISTITTPLGALDAAISSIAVTAGQVNTTADGTQGTSTTLNVADGTSIIDGSWLAITTTAGPVEYRQVASGGGTNAITLSVAHSGVTDGDLTSMLPAGLYEASVAANYGGTVTSPTLADQVEWTGRNTYNVMAYGAVADGVTDDQAAFYAAFAAASTAGSTGGEVIIPRAQYYISSTVNLDVPNSVTITAYGARITTDYDGVLFDLNPDFEFDFATIESRQNFHWRGGKIVQSDGHAVATSSTGIVFRGFRNAEIRDLEVEGFYTGIDISGKDTLSLIGCKFYENRRPVYNTPIMVTNSIINLALHRCHFSAGSATEIVTINESVAEIVISDGSFNFGQSTTDPTPLAEVTGLRINRYAKLYISSVTGTFAAGELVTSSGGATGTIAFVTTVSSGVVLAMESPRSGTFISAETVTSAGGAAGTISGLNINPTVRQITMRNIHIENNDTTTYPTVAALIQDKWGTGSPPTNITFDNVVFGNNADNSGGVRLAKCTSVVFRNCRWTHTSAKTNAFAFDLDADCQTIIFGEGCAFSTGLKTYACARSEISYGREVQRVISSKELGGTWDGGTGLSTVANATIDMSAVWSAFDATMPPRGYWLTIAARDSGSAAAAADACYVTLSRSTSDTLAFRPRLSLAGTPDDNVSAMSCFINADNNGDFNIARVATGAGTLDVWIRVDAILM